MQPHHLKYATANVPRYTSYPTAPHFQPVADDRVYRAQLAGLTADLELSLYVHIPFCQQLCWYCGCHTTVPNDYARAARYVDALVAEIALAAAAIGSETGPVKHLHFGGGTPTYLQGGEMDRIMAAAGAGFTFAADGERAIEIDPRTLTPDLARHLASLGINRASLGVQDFNPAVQAKINRHQPYALVARAADDLRAAGIAALSFDLIYGLPGQTVASVVRTADAAADLEPQRLSVFGYAHVPWFKKHQRMIETAELPDAEARFAQAAAISHALEARGYVEIGFDHFAHPDDPLAAAARGHTLNRNFQGYTTDQAAVLLGFGASAIGRVPNGHVQNITDIAAYESAVWAGVLPVSRAVVLTADDRLRRDAINDVMCGRTVDLEALCAGHGRPLDALDDALAALDAMAADGLLSRTGRRVTVLPQGRRFLRSIAAAFDAYLDRRTGRHSKAV